MDGAKPAAPSEALPGALPLETLKAFARSGTPVRVRWLDDATGTPREAVTRLVSVTDRQSFEKGRLATRWIATPDDYSASIDVASILSVEPAGLTSEEYDRTIQPAPPASLEDGLARIGLSQEQLASIQEHSGGFLGVRDLLARERTGLSIGVTDNLDQYTALTRLAGLKHWKVAYWKLYHDFQTPRTREFMDTVTKDGGPVYFFIPRDILKTDDEGIGYHPNTRDELLWLLEHPERMRNVRFVVGAYDLFSKRDENRLFSYGLRKGKGARRRFLQELLAPWRPKS